MGSFVQSLLCLLSLGDTRYNGFLPIRDCYFCANQTEEKLLNYQQESFVEEKT